MPTPKKHLSGSYNVMRPIISDITLKKVIQSIFAKIEKPIEPTDTNADADPISTHLIIQNKYPLIHL